MRHPAAECCKSAKETPHHHNVCFYCLLLHAKEAILDKETVRAADFKAMTAPREMSDVEFKDMFKLTRDQFAAVLAQIEPAVKRDPQKQQNVSGSCPPLCSVLPFDGLQVITLTAFLSHR